MTRSLIFTSSQTPSVQVPTVSQVIAWYENQTVISGNYARVAKGFLLYCLEHDYPLNDLSFDLYNAGRRPNLISTLRKFQRFIHKTNLTKVRADEPPKHSLPAANAWILQFLAESLTLRGDRSKETYMIGLNRFFNFLSEQGGALGAVTVNSFVLYLKQSGLSAFTINTYLASVKQFCQWVILHRERLQLHLSTDQLESLRDVSMVAGLPIERRYYKEGLEKEAREHLHRITASVREKSILTLMSTCGLRTIEVTRLKVGDVDLKLHLLHVLGKGKATKKPVKLFVVCHQVLEQYISTLEKPAPESLLFPGLTTRQIRYMTVKHLVKAGLRRKGISAHSLRHTAGQQLLAQGVDVLSVQRQLRHQRPETTHFYLMQRVEKDFLEKLPD
jgi:integrase/recombinase XerD